MIPNRLTYPLHPIIYMYISNQYTYIYSIIKQYNISQNNKYQFTNLKMLDDLGLISLSLPPTKRQTTNVNDTGDFWDPNSWSLNDGHHAGLTVWGGIQNHKAGWLLGYVEFTTWHTILSCTFPTANRLGFLLYSHGKGSKISSSCSQVVVMSTPQDMASTKSFSHKYIWFTLGGILGASTCDTSGLYILILSNCEGIGLELEGKQSISCLTPTQSHCNLYEFFHIEPSL